MSFLREVVTRLVREPVQNDAATQSNNFTKALEQGLKKVNENSTSIEFASAYLNQPFSAPPIFDMQKLVSLAQTQLNLHGDHLWLLQTDPSYMRRYHTVVLAGGLDETLTNQTKKLAMPFWLMKDAVCFWTWEWILEEVQKLNAIRADLSDDARAGHWRTTFSSR